MLSSGGECHTIGQHTSIYYTVLYDTILDYIISCCGMLMQHMAIHTEYVYIYTCIYRYTCVYIYIYIHMYIHTYTQTDTFASRGAGCGHNIASYTILY